MLQTSTTNATATLNISSASEVFDLCAPAVYGKILSIVHNETIASKLLEKVFIDAYKHKNVFVYEMQTPLISLLNHSRKKSNKTVEALNIFRECCGGTTINITDKK